LPFRWELVILNIILSFFFASVGEPYETTSVLVKPTEHLHAGFYPSGRLNKYTEQEIMM